MRRDLGVLRVPGFIGPQWERVRPFALKSAAQFRPRPPAATSSQPTAATLPAARLARLSVMRHPSGGHPWP